MHRLCKFQWTSTDRTNVITLDIHEKTGEVKGTNIYEVTLTSCNYPQRGTRCAVAGAFCKHICGLQIKSAEMQVVPDALTV
ncbi:MAG: hypothetical protein V4671_17290 [Armatimonadota bacterium]